MPKNEQTNMGVTVLAGVIDPEYQEHIGLLWTMKVKKSMSGLLEIPKGVS